MIKTTSARKFRAEVVFVKMKNGICLLFLCIILDLCGTVLFVYDVVNDDSRDTDSRSYGEYDYGGGVILFSDGASSHSRGDE